MNKIDSNIKKINSNLLIAFVLIMIGALLIGGATVALFTDIAQNTDNVFAAGTLSIDLTKQFGADSFNFSNIAPGDNGSDTIVVQNTGSLELRYRMDSLTKTGYLLNNEGDHPMEFTFTVGSEAFQPVNTTRVLGPGNSETITVNWEMPLAAGNDYQGESGTLGISFSAEQTANN